MIQSTLHVAVIMDGNGRWANRLGSAARRGTPRGRGSAAGDRGSRAGLGVGTLTAYAFSSDNWKRPAEEVEVLMALLAWYLEEETPRLLSSGVRLSVIGRRDRLPGACWRPSRCGANHRTTARACTCGWRSTIRRGMRFCGRRTGMSGRFHRSGSKSSCELPARASGGSADPDRRGAAPERLPAMGVRLCGTGFHAAHVAGVRCRATLRQAIQAISSAETALRRDSRVSPMRLLPQERWLR